MTFPFEQDHCINCTCKAPLFRFLTLPEFENVNAHRYEIFYRPGEVIFKQGSPATHVLSFTHGLAKIVFEDAGRNIILGLIKPGAFLAGPGIHIQHRHHYSIVSLTDSKVCAIDHSVFSDLLVQNKAFMTNYLQEVNSAYLDSLYRLARQVHKQVKGKVADVLLYLSESVFESTCFKYLLSTREIAELSGVSKESAARTLKEFSDDAIIVINRKQLRILNPELLGEISRFG